VAGGGATDGESQPRPTTAGNTLSRIRLNSAVGVLRVSGLTAGWERDLQHCYLSDSRVIGGTVTVKV
jgi:hypothetical protein